jgi:transposase
MIPVPSGVWVWLAVGYTDMRRGMNSLALQVQEGLNRAPHAARRARGSLSWASWVVSLASRWRRGRSLKL